MFGRKKTQPGPEPAPPPELSALGRAFADEGALDPAQVDPSRSLIDLLRDGNFTGPRPIGVEVDGEFGWEAGGDVTVEGHLTELFTSTTAVMRDRGVDVSFGEITVDEDGVWGIVDGDRVRLASVDQPGSPVLHAVTGALAALNAAAARAGSDRCWYFALIDDGTGPAWFLTTEQAAGLVAESGQYPDGSSPIIDPQDLIG